MSLDSCHIIILVYGHSFNHKISQHKLFIVFKHRSNIIIRLSFISFQIWPRFLLVYEVITFISRENIQQIKPYDIP